MTAEKLFAIIGETDESLVAEALAYKRKKLPMALIGLAACIALALLVSVISSPWKTEGEEIPPGSTACTFIGEQYKYNVSSGEFAGYISGKVIPGEKLGEKLTDVTVDAGWFSGDGTRKTEETLRAEVYLIKGVPEETAVALRFLDKGDALTTEHYYVIINPDADPSPVKEYMIGYSAPTAPDDTRQEDIVSMTTSSRAQ